MTPLQDAHLVDRVLADRKIAIATSQANAEASMLASPSTPMQSRTIQIVVMRVSIRCVYVPDVLNMGGTCRMPERLPCPHTGDRGRAWVVRR